jgi:hypothetical protein
MDNNVDLIYLAEDRDQWRAALRVVMNLHSPEMARNFLTS